MDVSNNFLLFSASLPLFIVSPSIQASFMPKAQVLSCLKDALTSQYVIQIKQRTPLLPIKLTLDLVESLASCVKGVASLGRTKVSMPWQLSSAFSEYRYPKVEYRYPLHQKGTNGLKMSPTTPKHPQRSPTATNSFLTIK
ncbi:hypothetical protein GQ457_14G005950 [Hibiscus cannabinus]